MQSSRTGRRCVFSVLQSILPCFKFMIPDGSPPLIELCLVTHVTVSLLPPARHSTFLGDYRDSCYPMPCASGGLLVRGTQIHPLCEEQTALTLCSSNNAVILFSPQCHVSPPLMLFPSFYGLFLHNFLLSLIYYPL